MAMFEREHIFQSIIFGIHVEFPVCNFIWCTSKYLCFFSLFRKKKTPTKIWTILDSKRDKMHPSDEVFLGQEFDKEFEKNMTTYTSNIDQRHKVGFTKARVQDGYF